MRINTNISAMNAHRQLGINTANGAKSMERLSSGLRINRSADDAAGLAISEKMRGQIRGLNQASRNAQDGISLIQTAEGSLTETHSILQRMRELAAQAATDTNVGVDRNEIQKELNALTSEINRIGNTTEFNSQKLLNGGAIGALTGVTNVEGIAGVTAVAAVWNTGAVTPLGDNTSGTFIFNGVTVTVSTGGAAAAVVGDGTVSIGIANTATADTTAAAVISALGAYKASAYTELDSFSFSGNGAGIIITGNAADGDANNALTITGTIGLVNRNVSTPGVDGVTAQAGSTTFTIDPALAAGESFDVAGQTITAYADAVARAAANGGAGDAYGILATDTAAGQAAAIRGMTFADATVTGANETVIITQTLAGTGDVTGPTAVQNAGGAGYNADLQIGANYAQSFRINIADMRAVALDISGSAAAGSVTANDGAVASYVSGTANVSQGTSNVNSEFALDVSSHAKATAAISVISDAIETVSAERSKLGAMQNRLEHTIANLGTSSENLQAAESRIRDVDMAAEMMEFTKSNILNQAATAMLAQANMAPQSVLQLLG